MCPRCGGRQQRKQQKLLCSRSRQNFESLPLPPQRSAESLRIRAESLHRRLHTRVRGHPVSQDHNFHRMVRPIFSRSFPPCWRASNYLPARNSFTCQTVRMGILFKHEMSIPSKSVFLDPLLIFLENVVADFSKCLNFFSSAGFSTGERATQ